jgi:hypothetical protein
MTKIKKFALSLAILAIVVGFTPMFASADDRNTHSIIGDYFNKVFDIRLTDGSTALDTSEDRKERERINGEIFDGTSVDYSLYDRFGGDIRFVPYLGETRIETGIFDRFYTKFMENESEFKLTLDDIKLFFQQPAVSNNVIYTGRPNILSSEEIDSGFRDPRVFAYSGISTTGGDAAVGNFYLGVSKFSTSFVSFFASNGLYKLINEVMVEVMDAGLADIVSALAMVFLPLLVAIALFGVVKSAVKLVKGDMALRKFLAHLASGVISLGLIFSFVAAPMSLGNLLLDAVTIVDDVFDEALQLNADEVVVSSTTKNVREAVLWRVSVFEPWCNGMFGDKYQHLYTQHASLQSDQMAMPQSNDDVLTAWGDESLKYNSVKITGDVMVPLGVKEVRNWAALAWSCQSLYHIESTVLDYDRIPPSAWPRAELTPNNKQMYVDNFRWLDAYLNISPEYRSPEKVRMNYSASRLYEQNFVDAGLQSLVLTLLMLPILVLGLRKTVVSIKMVMMGVILVYRSAFNFVMPNRYDALSNLKKVLVPIYDYLWWSIVAFLAIVLYRNLAGDNALANIVWLVAGVYLNFIKPIRTTARLNRIYQQGKAGVLKVANRLKRKVKG